MTERVPAFELAILKILWHRGECSVRQVAAYLPKDSAYTTVQTILNIMTRKKRTTRILSGRAYLYTANVTREEVQQAELSSLLSNVFGDCARDLMKMLKADTASKTSRARPH